MFLFNKYFLVVAFLCVLFYSRCLFQIQFRLFLQNVNFKMNRIHIRMVLRFFFLFSFYLVLFPSLIFINKFLNTQYQYTDIIVRNYAINFFVFVFFLLLILLHLQFFSSFSSSGEEDFHLILIQLCVVFIHLKCFHSFLLGIWLFVLKSYIDLRDIISCCVCVLFFLFSFFFTFFAAAVAVVQTKQWMRLLMNILLCLPPKNKVENAIDAGAPSWFNYTILFIYFFFNLI